MWQALGALLPIAVAVAISSVPITAMILILLSPKRNRAALPFLIGWMIGIAAVISLSALGAQALPEPPRRGADTLTAVLEISVGLALIVLTAIYLRGGSPSERTGMPRWLSAVGSFGALASFGVAVVLNVRPKGLLLGIAAGLALHAANLKLSETAVLIGIYTVIGASTVAVPIISSFIAPRRVEAKLIASRDWLSQNGRILTSTMMFVIGVVILGGGLTKL